MERLIKLSAVWAVMTVASMSSAFAQYPDYLMGYITPQTKNALIRYYSPTEAVAVYRNYRATPSPVFYTTVCVVDNSGYIHSVDLDDGYDVFDMEVVGNYLFMCGRHNTSKAFIGCLKIPDIFTSSTRVNYHIIPGDISDFKKMVAFVDQNSDIKVVALGTFHYITPPLILSLCSISGITSCPPPYTCGLDFIIETTNPQNYPPGNLPYDMKFITDGTEIPEIIDDIVLTDNYVVFIGQGSMGGNLGLTMHPCPKTSILPNFNDYYLYPTVDERFDHYTGCHMCADTIAVATRGRYLSSGWSEWDTRIRVIDAASHVMTSSQAFDLNDYKSDPIDMVYLKNEKTLVLLEDIKYPPASGVNNYSFIFLNPYQTFSGTPTPNPPLAGYPPYSAKGFFESTRSLPFWSMDRTASHDAIVATGGDYWILKSIPLITPGHNCYKPIVVKIHKLDNIVGIQGHYPYCGCSSVFVSHDRTHTPSSSMVSGSCF